ncbi:DUF2298 domain-containing protein [Patescibacteria group bacterium]
MNELFFVGQWYLVLLILGIISIPTTTLLFGKFFDKGFGLSKTISILFVSYLVFLMGTSRLAKFGPVSLFVGILIFIIINLFILSKSKIKIITLFKNHKRSLIISELLFLFGFLLWTYVRAHQPDINGLEKFMDYGFIKATLESEYLPPNDMWAAGETINYYWYGHFVSAMLVRLSNIPAAVGYNLMLATIMGLLLSSVFSVGSTLVHTIKKLPARIPIITGILCALLVVFAGNFHTPYYVIKEGMDDYWYPDATRFIGHNPETDDKTIHEFPIYSFVVSDLHAHVLSLPFVIVVIAILANLFINKYEFRDFFWLHTILLSFVMGIIFMTNSWDFGNYLVVIFVSLFLYVFRVSPFKLKSLGILIFVPIYIIILAVLFASPFLAGFESIAEGVRLVKDSSPLWQLVILWGFPLLMSVSFLVFLISNYIHKIRKSRSLHKLLGILYPQDLFVIGLILAGWTLIVLPEIFYLKDIYEATHHRANTMFKLTYQAYFVFYLSSGYIIIRTLSFSRGTKRAIFMFIYLLSLVGVFIYPYISVRSYYDHLRNYKSISGDTWMLERKPDYFATIKFLESQDGVFNIVEAAGDSYTEFNLVSAYSGIPTVNGWFVHEWLWRGDSAFPQLRGDEIKNIYTADDQNLAKQLLDKYKVRYVIVGPHEREKYMVNELLFDKLGNQVFQSGGVKVYEVN